MIEFKFYQVKTLLLIALITNIHSLIEEFFNGFYNKIINFN